MTLARRTLLGASLAAAGTSLYGTPAVAHPSTALARLLEGNSRWVTGRLADRDPADDRRRRVAGAQHPFAVVFSCIDSRVPAEVVFDQDLGDLFVVRTAGEVLDPLVTGCLEYAPAHGVPLVFVLGHTACGAVKATIESIEDGARPPGRLGLVVAALRPAYLLAKPGFRPHWTRDQCVDATVTAQVYLAVDALRADPVIRDNGAMVAGGRYDLRSGVVTRVV